MIDPRQPDFSSTPVAKNRAKFGYMPLAAEDSGCAREVGDDAPAVSIITPFYNTGTVFHETVRSVLNQSLVNFEWIIVDDGSTNATSIAMLREVAASDVRIRVVRLATNIGPGGGRNAGIRAARAAYVFQLDADDLIEATALEKCVWFLAANPGAAFVKGWTVGFQHNPHLWCRGFHDRAHFLQENVSTITAMLRRQAFLDVGGYDEKILGGMEDWDLWMRFASRGMWGATIPEYLDWYRRRPNHADVWEDWDGAERQHKFTQRLRQNYPSLNAENFPDAGLQNAFPFQDVPKQVPVRNQLSGRDNRLLLIVPWLTMGGADKFNIRFIEQLVTRGWEVTVASTLSGDQAWLAQFTKHTPDVFVMPHFLPASHKPLFLRYLIESRKPRYVVTTNSELGYLVLPYLRAHCPDPVYADYCHMEEDYWKNGGYPRYAAGCQEQLDLNIVSSGHLKEWMIARGGSAARIEVCTTNEDASQWKPDAGSRLATRKQLEINEQTAVLLYAGRICDQKQPRVFASTILELSKLGLDFVAIVAGDGVDRPMLEEFAARHGITKHLRFLGAVPNARMPSLMAASDIFFLPSLWEGISLAIYEAMSSGLAIVGGDVGGQRELVTSECGTLIKRSSPEKETLQYVDALVPLIADPAHARAVGARGRQRITDHYQLTHMGDRMISLLERAAELKVSDPRPAVPIGLGHELAVRAMEYLRLHDLADSLWTERERLRAMVGGAPAAHSSLAAPSVGLGAPEGAAEIELSVIENSRFYGLVCAAKRNPLYRVIARLRWGPKWNQMDPAEPAPQRLARIKGSRTYKLIQSVKSTGIYRVYALRKYGGLPTLRQQSHTHGVSSNPERM